MRHIHVTQFAPSLSCIYMGLTTATPLNLPYMDSTQPYCYHFHSSTLCRCGKSSGSVRAFVSGYSQAYGIHQYPVPVCANHVCAQRRRHVCICGVGRCARVWANAARMQLSDVRGCTCARQCCWRVSVNMCVCMLSRVLVKGGSMHASPIGTSTRHQSNLGFEWHNILKMQFFCSYECSWLFVVFVFPEEQIEWVHM